VYETDLLSWRVVDARVSPLRVPSPTQFCYQLGECTNDIAIVKLESRADRLGNTFRLGEKIGWLNVALNGGGLAADDTSPSKLVTRLHYHNYLDENEKLLRVDYPATLNQELGVITSQSPEIVDPATGAGDQPATAPLSFGGGPWIINFGEPPHVPDAISVGFDLTRNSVVAVSQYLYGTGQPYASYFTQENFGVIYEEFCNLEPRDCFWEAPDDLRNDALRFNLEEPIEGGSYAGIGNIRGWFFDEFPLDDLKISIDDGAFVPVPFGGVREDVGDAFPNFPLAATSGFSMAFGYGNLEPGTHTIRAIATTITGEFTEASAEFEVVAFHKNFISREEVVDATNAAITGAGNLVEMKNVSVDGRSYDVELRWSPETQGFEIVSITSRE
jgi:hypothetical protein